jgi:hypothetical protein
MVSPVVIIGICLVISATDESSPMIELRIEVQSKGVNALAHGLALLRGRHTPRSEHPAGQRTERLRVLAQQSWKGSTIDLKN